MGFCLFFRKNEPVEENGTKISKQNKINQAVLF